MNDKTKVPSVAPDYDLETLFEAGCHFGHKAKRWHPKMAEYIYTQKNGVHIFDLAKTAAQLQQAYDLVYQLGKTGKKIIFVGTKKQAREIIQTQAQRAGAMYITSRWMGGFLTNWNQIYKSIKKMKDIEKGLEGDKFEGYTKFERVQLEKQQNRLERFFIGVKDIKGKPDAIFVVDADKEAGAIEEASQLKVPVIAIVDSNTNPSKVTLPIPANDDSVKSIEFIVSQIADAYKAGQEKKKSK